MQERTLFQKVVEEGLTLGRAKIGFGLNEPDREILESLERTAVYADIVLVGPKKIESIEGFEKVISENPEGKIAEMLVDGEVEGIIRGTIDDFKTYEAYQNLVGKDKTKSMIELALLEEPRGKQFYLSAGSNPIGWTKEEKISCCEHIVKFMKEEMRIEPKIGCVTGVRHETYQREKAQKEGVQGILNQTYEDAECLVDYFKEKGIDAENYAIEIETAIEDGCNIIVPPNGMTGNQIFRTLCLVGGGRLLTASRGNLPHVYEDNSRNEKDFEQHVKWVVAWVNKRKGGERAVLH